MLIYYILKALKHKDSAYPKLAETYNVDILSWQPSCHRSACFTLMFFIKCCEHALVMSSVSRMQTISAGVCRLLFVWTDSVSAPPRWGWTYRAICCLTWLRPLTCWYLCRVSIPSGGMVSGWGSVMKLHPWYIPLLISECVIFPATPLENVLKNKCRRPTRLLRNSGT